MYCKVLIIIGIISTLSCRMNAQPLIDHPISSPMPGNIARESVLYFRFDRSTVDYGYHNNRKVLSSLHELFSDSLWTSRIDSVRIRTYSSPEGNDGYNRRLALQRARAVKGYLVWKYPHLDQHRIHTSAYAEKWDVLRSIAERDTLLPGRNEILQILNRNGTPDRSDAHKSNEHIEVLLKKLNAGIPYRYISENILPDLRNASIYTVYMRPLKHPGVQEQPAPVLTNNSNSNSPLPFRTERKILSSVCTQSSADFKSAETEYKDFQSDMYPRKPLFAVKTNLLFDAALMPNIEVEVPIGKRFSLNGELMFPWWLMDGDKYCMQVLMGGLEGRYWLGSRKNRMNRELLTGHFLGLYAAGGKYDLQWKENGYQGEFFIAAGVSYGYAHKIARNLRLEYNIGIGLLRTDYRHYHARDNYQTLLWQENGKYTWIGPTKMKISLVWMLTGKTGKGGEK